MTTVQDLENRKCTMIDVHDLHDGHLTAMGFVIGEPKFSPSGKTVLVTVRKHSGGEFTDRRSATAKIAVWIPKDAGPVCECGQPGTEVCYRRGSAEEIWFCGSRKHTARVRELSAQGWMSQSAVNAASAMGEAMRRRAQSA